MQSISDAYAQCADPTGNQGEIIYNESAVKFQSCMADNTWQALHGDTGVYVPNTVEFEGDYLNLTSDLAGVSDTKTMFGSFWFRSDNSKWQRILRGTGARVVIEVYPAYVRFSAYNSAGAYILRVEQGGVINGQWNHILFAIDLEGGLTKELYINDIDVGMDLFTYVDDFIDYTNGGWAFGGVGVDNLDADIADFWFDSNTFLDISVEANRRKFIDANGNPVFLGTDGSLATGSAPDIFLSGDTATWHTNKGSGGGFTENGTLTTASSGPYERNTDGPQSGLVGWWKLDETSGTTAVDSSGGGNDGTMLDDLNASSDSVNGPVETALVFDGTDDAVELNGFSVGPTNSLTITGWIKASDPNKLYQGIVYQRYGGTHTSGLQTRASTGMIGYTWNNDGGTYIFNSNLYIPTDNWAFVAVAIEPSQATLYLGSGGALGSAVNIHAHPPLTLDSIHIGQDEEGIRDFVGAIDDVRIYNRTLTPTELQELYSIGFDCDNPFGKQGEMIYNSSESLFQGCTIDGWIALHEAGSGGGGCSSPVGATGEIIYNSSDDLYQGCTADGWFAFHQ